METAPDNADVWYLVGYLSNAPDRKRSAFRRAQGIDPKHKKALSAMNSLN